MGNAPGGLEPGGGEIAARGLGGRRRGKVRGFRQTRRSGSGTGEHARFERAQRREGRRRQP